MATNIIIPTVNGRKIKPDNKIWFKYSQEAEKAGYKTSKACMTGQDDNKKTLKTIEQYIFSGVQRLFC